MALFLLPAITPQSEAKPSSRTRRRVILFNTVLSTIHRMGEEEKTSPLLGDHIDFWLTPVFATCGMERRFHDVKKIQ